MGIFSWFLIKLSGFIHLKGVIDGNIQISKAHRYQLSIAIQRTKPKLGDVRTDHFTCSLFYWSAIWAGLSWEVLLLISLRVTHDTSIIHSGDLWSPSAGPYVSPSRIIWAGG